MALTLLPARDANGAAVNISGDQDPTNANGFVGTTSLTDPVTGQKAAVQQFHNADNQSPGGTAYGLLTGGVAQLLNAAGNIDRQRETGFDGVPAQGITSGAAQFAQAIKTSDALDNFAPGTRTFTPASMSGTTGGVPWAIQAGSGLTLEPGTANSENVIVTAVTATTFTCLTTKAHNGTGTPFTITGFVFNQERDAAGEADGATGVGTAVAAEYEYNGGDPSGGNYDRARSLNAKAFVTQTINAGGGAASKSLTLAANAGLKAGTKVLLFKAGTFPAAGSYEVVNVDLSYVEGTNTVPLASAIVGNPVYDTIAYDGFAALGPQLNGFLPFGTGIEMTGIFDPVSAKLYIERSATQDAMPPQNIVAEAPAVWNGTSFDRGRSGSAVNLATQQAVGSEMVTGPGQWSLVSAPGAAAQPTATKAAGAAGVRHVCTGISATVAPGATAQVPVLVNLRDGATGVGAILWSGYLQAPANGLGVLTSPPLNIPGSAATAMTIEFAAAPVAAAVGSVSATGYDAV